LRKERQLSQEALALEAGAERDYISLLEIGRDSPSLRIPFKICAVLGVPPSALLAEVEEVLTIRKRRTKSR